MIGKFSESELKRRFLHNFGIFNKQTERNIIQLITYNLFNFQFLIQNNKAVVEKCGGYDAPHFRFHLNSMPFWTIEKIQMINFCKVSFKVQNCSSK